MGREQGRVYSVGSCSSGPCTIPGAEGSAELRVQRVLTAMCRRLGFLIRSMGSHGWFYAAEPCEIIVAFRNCASDYHMEMRSEGETQGWEAWSQEPHRRDDEGLSQEEGVPACLVPQGGRGLEKQGH